MALSVSQLADADIRAFAVPLLHAGFTPEQILGLFSGMRYTQEKNWAQSAADIITQRDRIQGMKP
jgi:hypothetical protein